MESDYIQKKNYIPKFLWDEKNEKTKKIGVNAMDTLLFLSRMSRESSIFSFTNNSNQRILSKVKYRNNLISLATSIFKSEFVNVCIELCVRID
jgi:fructose-1,6-bisphosphatase/sedoheptulose 1,7-bisphosphatase-like protein